MVYASCEVNAVCKYLFLSDPYCCYCLLDKFSQSEERLLGSFQD